MNSMLLDTSTTRSEFPSLNRLVHNKWPLIYFDNGASTQRARCVIEAMNECENEYYANVHRGNYWNSEKVSAEYEYARESIRRFLNAKEVSEIIFTQGTTASINLVAHAWGNSRLKPGDEILLTIADHHSNIVPWQQLAARTGATIRWYDHDIENGIDPQRWGEMLNPNTRIAAFPAVSNMLGFRAPCADLVKLAHRQGATVLIDAAQHVPHEPTDVQAWNADFVVFSGHKLAGPTGIGVLYARRELLESLPPFLGGGSMIDQVTREGFTQGALPARFEAGTPPIVQAIGLGAAVRYLESVGMEHIAAHERRLTTRAMALMQDITRLRIYGPPAENHTGMVTFNVEGVNAQDLGKMLDLRGVATRAGHHCTMPLHDQLGIRSSLRASFFLYNTLDEVESFLQHLRKAIERLIG